VALYLLYRGIRDRRYFEHLVERLGFLPSTLESTGSGAIWFHAVSVGEVLTAVPLIRRLRSERPLVRVYLSTTTLAGRASAEEKLEGLVARVFFAPLDFRSSVRRVLRRLRPALVVVLETEIWPNLYRESKRAGASLIIVNGRISDRALPRYRRFRTFFRYVLRWPDAILVQSEEDRKRYIAAGAPPDNIAVTGNLKYDFTPPASGMPPELARFIEHANPSQVWIAASTMPPAEAGDVDEDDAVIAAFQTLCSTRNGLLLILAPRKPERFDLVAEKLKDSGIAFTRRSKLVDPTPRVLLLDSIGELAALFECADVVFMGGTLARRGGHNILEPAYFAKPIIVGPHLENFAEIANSFYAAEALERIEDQSALASAVRCLLDDPERAAVLGQRARDLARSRRGVVAAISHEIWRAYGQGVPDPPRVLAARLLLTPLTWLWRAGHRLHLELAKKRALNTRVVSVGGLTMGGVGKSPMVAYLAARLRDPAILTRGYKRKSGSAVIIVPRGKTAPTEVTGDEAQIFIRGGYAHVGIGKDRFAVGRRIEAELKPDIFLLDDGFQHFQLRRDHDIVLIDALDPLGGGAFPLGRLREPLEGLARAGTIVITRVEPGQDISGIEHLLRRYNAQAPLFRSRVVPREWVDVESGLALDLAGAKLGRVAAFCGLGSPRSFWRTLEELGIEVGLRQAFEDHHQYSLVELKRLAQHAADVLVTTEKDAMNLPEGASAIVAPLKLLWLRIGIEIEKEDELLKRIL